MLVFCVRVFTVVVVTHLPSQGQPYWLRGQRCTRSCWHPETPGTGHEFSFRSPLIAGWPQRPLFPERQSGITVTPQRFFLPVGIPSGSVTFELKRAGKLAHELVGLSHTWACGCPAAAPRTASPASEPLLFHGTPWALSPVTHIPRVSASLAAKCS